MPEEVRLWRLQGDNTLIHGFTTKPLGQMTKDFGLSLIEACNEIMRLTLHRHADTPR